MITKFFPGGFQRYLSLPILGPLMDNYASWLHARQYTWRSARYELWGARPTGSPGRTPSRCELHRTCFRTATPSG